MVANVGFKNRRRRGAGITPRSAGEAVTSVEIGWRVGDRQAHRTRPRPAGPQDASATGKPLPSRAQLPDVTEREPPGGWTVWNAEPGGRVIYAYRPDVFDSDRFPAACLPTLTVAPGAPNRPASEAELGPTDVWRVEFFLEPDVTVRPARTYDSREAAIDGALEIAEQFVAGELDYRDAYQVPREAYLERLDELTGREA